MCILIYIILKVNDASIKIKKGKVSFVIKAYSGNKSRQIHEFTEGTPLELIYLPGSYIYTIEQENSYVYLHYNFERYNIECYTKVQYSNNVTIEIGVLYI